MATTITVRRAQPVNRSAVVLTALLAGGATIRAAAADDRGLVVTAGGGYSDNANRVATNEESSGFASVGLDLSLDRKRELSRLFANGAIEYHEFLDGQVPGEFQGNLSLAAQLGSRSGRFTWFIGDAISSVRENFARPLAPGNSQLSNDFSTGPNLRLSLIDAWRLVAEGRYARHTFESSSFDSERLGGQVTIERAFADNRSAGVGVSFENQKYDRPTGGTLEFDREERPHRCQPPHPYERGRLPKAGALLAEGRPPR